MATKLLGPLLALFLCLNLGGCASYFAEQHFERTATPDAVRQLHDAQPGKARVFLFRKRLPGQDLLPFAVLDHYFAVDGRMVSVMPYGSYVVLHLEPGYHSFARLVVDGGGILPVFSLQQHHVNATFVAGKTYYIGSTNAGFRIKAFVEVAADEGQEVVAEARLAKLVHMPVTVAEFRERVQRGRSPEQAVSNAPEAVAANPTQSAPPPTTSPPSAIGEFLAALAGIFLAAVVLVGAASAAGAQGVADSSVVVPYASPAPVAAPTYRLQGTSLKGSTGSRYTIIGSTIYSDTGETYRVIGNTLYSSDGRSCRRAGNTVYCN